MRSGIGEINDEKILRAIKQCLTGMTTKEVTSEYIYDDEQGKMKMVKQKINEKNLPPNTDLIKLVFQRADMDENKYEKMTDEELLREREKLLKQLKEEEENAGGKSKTKS